MLRSLHRLAAATFVILGGSAAVLTGCADDAAHSTVDLVGTWEVTGEAGTLNRNGTRYTFAEDSTLRIFRPRALGPSSTILAVYDFSGDTLVIRSQFDAELLLPRVSGDTLVLTSLGSGDPMMLVRRDEEAAPSVPAPPAQPPTPVTGDTVDFPPPNAPQEGL